MQVKTIILTGATGFLGSHLAGEFVNQGHEVIVLKKQTSNLKRIRPILSQVTTYDLEGLELSKPFKDHGKIDAVIHAATCYGRNNESIGEIFEANIVFPLRLLETAILFNTDTFFNTDTILNKYLNSYALSKRHFMEWGKQLSSMGRIRFVNIRLEHMYGPSDDDSKFATYIICGCLNNVPELKLTAGQQRRDFIYIDDVVEAYAVLLGRYPNLGYGFHEYDIGSGRAISIREFVETAHRLTSSRTKLLFGALPYRENEIMHSEANVERLKALGWECRVSLTEGISAVIQEEQKV